MRNIILPTIEQHFPGAGAQLGKTVQQVRSCASLYDELIEQAQVEICEQKDDVLLVDCARLLRFTNANTLLFEILKSYGFNYAQCTDILKAFGSEHGVGKHFYSSTFTLTVLRTKLEVFVYKVKLECAYGINLCDNYISQPVKMEVKKVSRTQHDLKSCNGKDVIALSCDVENAKNVVVRHWKNGDRFRPFGMKGSKLLSDLFTDLKLSEREKQEVWVMEADGDIIWVIGHRASALYKVGADDDAYFVVSLCK